MAVLDQDTRNEFKSVVLEALREFSATTPVVNPPVQGGDPVDSVQFILGLPETVQVLPNGNVSLARVDALRDIWSKSPDQDEVDFAKRYVPLTFFLEDTDGVTEQQKLNIHQNTNKTMFLGQTLGFDKRFMMPACTYSKKFSVLKLSTEIVQGPVIPGCAATCGSNGSAFKGITTNEVAPALVELLGLFRTRPKGFPLQWRPDPTNPV